ncbi:cell division protein FtsQ/DivIB [Sphingomonas sp.]|uniref:cell division protein FtsQ/DivIB n=1 Tax=Sphingomonas sp. TaxID=28214 RepID=UPI0017EF7A3D|nr:cell division protein FtsQ/DivIB [Sphingomonas sp.]MBA3510903.1 FtsQ-type POTRA domain-containing protein [Sphingomonas sp.]
MTAAHVRRGGPARPKQRKAKPKRGAGKAGQARANRLAGLAFSAFLLAMGVVVVIALDIPSKAATSTGAAIGRAGFTVSGYRIVGLNRMNRAQVDAVIVDELRQASESAGGSKPAQPLVDVAAIRNRLLQFGWVKDARVSRRLPDTLVIDIVERRPEALWQDKQQLALIDGDGVVLDRVRVDQMPDLPLLIGPGANARARDLGRLMDLVPTLKPQLASATWIGRRRWDLAFQTGETVALPEDEGAARQALTKFAKVDRSSGLLGRGLVRFDLRVPGKMTVRLPRAPGEAITPEAASEG